MREYSSKFRIWHWLFAFSILGVSVTVLLRETYLNSYDMADSLKEEILSLGVNLELEQARDISHILTGGFWDWHIYFGYAFAFFLLVRIGMLIKNGFDYPKDTSIHKKLVYSSYKFLYLILFVLASCGIVLHLGELNSIDEDSLWIFEEIHGIFGYIIMIFIPLHIIGVVVSDIKEDKGLISRIISGSKK